MIDWPAVAKRYAGIEINPYFTGLRMVSWYYTWDVASGCVWHEDGIKSVSEIPLKPFINPYEEDEYESINQETTEATTS